jgi:hypothetical protein
MFRNNPERAFREPGWAVLTATQEAKGSATDEANVKANQDLEAELQKRGIAYQPVKGSYQGVDQGANFLIFADEAVAKELGAKYGQESVLTTKGLVYTDGSGKLVPAVHKNDIVGDEARKEDFYSELPDGTAFSLGLNFDEAPAEPVTASTTRTWYSGAPKGLEELSPREAREGNLYGPGVYLAQSKEFADTYGRGDNQVYELTFDPKNAFNTSTINSRSEAEKMLTSMGVKKSELSGLLGQRPRVANDTVYEALTKSLGSKKEANAALKDAGYDAILFKDRRGNQLAVSFNAVSTSGTPAEVDVESYSNARGAVIDEEKVPFLIGLTKKQAQVSLIADLYSPFKLEERPKFKTVAQVAAYRP